MFIQKALPKKTTKPRTPIYGIGINDADYVIGYRDSQGKTYSCPYYETWRGMLERCYSQKFHERQPSYKGCTVYEPWKILSNFRKWMETQDWQDKTLDKDLIGWGQKHYSPDTCLFVPKAINSLLVLRGNHRGEYPLGVIKVVTGKYEYFEAKCSFYGKQKRLGLFKTVEEAASCYKEAKLKYISELAEKESDPRIKQALLNLW